MSCCECSLSLLQIRPDQPNITAVKYQTWENAPILSSWLYTLKRQSTSCYATWTVNTHPSHLTTHVTLPLRCSLTWSHTSHSPWGVLSPDHTRHTPPEVFSHLTTHVTLPLRCSPTWPHTSHSLWGVLSPDHTRHPPPELLSAITIWRRIKYLVISIMSSAIGYCGGWDIFCVCSIVSSYCYK